MAGCHCRQSRQSPPAVPASKHGQTAKEFGNHTAASTLGQGLKANQLNEQEAQQRMENNDNSIFGGALTGAADIGMNALSSWAGGL